MKRTESTLTSDDGSPIFLRHWAPDEGTPARGAIQVVHGLAEHSGRYEGFGEALAEAGYLVYASDHRGHGRTVQEERDLGFLGPDGRGWDLVQSDLWLVHEHVTRTHSTLPRFLVGHSMGSFLGLDFATRHPDALAGLVLSASKAGGGPLNQAGRLAARVERARLGPRGRSGVLNFLSFGSYNKPFAPARTEFDWLSRDDMENDAYVADPRCGFVATTQLWVDLLDALVRLGDGATFRRVPRTLPIYMIAGSDDPVANQDPDFDVLAQRLTAAGVKDLRTHRYPGGRHELFHETNRADVFADLASWLEEHLP